MGQSWERIGTVCVACVLHVCDLEKNWERFGLGRGWPHKCSTNVPHNSTHILHICTCVLKILPMCRRCVELLRETHCGPLYETVGPLRNHTIRRRVFHLRPWHCERFQMPTLFQDVRVALIGEDVAARKGVLENVQLNCLCEEVDEHSIAIGLLRHGCEQHI